MGNTALFHIRMEEFRLFGSTPSENLTTRAQAIEHRHRLRRCL